VRDYIAYRKLTIFFGDFHTAHDGMQRKLGSTQLESIENFHIIRCEKVARAAQKKGKSRDRDRKEWGKKSVQCLKVVEKLISLGEYQWVLIDAFWNYRKARGLKFSPIEWKFIISHLPHVVQMIIFLSCWKINRLKCLSLSPSPQPAQLYGALY
jgi:hypothetical protein